MASAVEPDGAKWFKKVVPLFTAPSVPEMSPAEAPALLATRFAPVPVPPGLPGKEIAQHLMLYVGEAYNKMILASKGKVIWTYSTGPGDEYGDVWMLSNGNILFTRMQYVAEVTPDKKVVWRYDAPEGIEIHSCQPIGLDKVLFLENGLPPHLKAINMKTNSVEVEHELPVKSLTDCEGVHGQFRRVRYRAQGTNLVSFFTMNRVVEYDKNFDEVWSYDVSHQWIAIWLKNGNTLINDEKDIKTFEVTPDKKVVWQVIHRILALSQECPA